jgi:ribosomal protein S18 acetylase RimI-like enzyme
MTARVRPAAEGDLDDLVRLFRAYLDFYERPHPADRARGYLAERLEGGDSVVLVAEGQAGLVGFAQCYPTWSSLELSALWVLEDLFVTPSARRSGVGAALLETVVTAAEVASACEVVLETQHANAAAIALYERFGFTRSDEFATYVFDLGPF